MTDEKTDLVPLRVEEGGLIQPEYIHYEQPREGTTACGAPLESSEYVDVTVFLGLALSRSQVDLCKQCYVMLNKSFRINDESVFYHYLDPQTEDKKYLCGLDVPATPFEQSRYGCMLCEYEFIVVRGGRIKELRNERNRSHQR